MTVLVGVEHDGGAIIGADSFFGNGSEYSLTADTKVFWVDGVLFGTCGSARLKQLFKYRLTVPSQRRGKGDDEYVATDLADAIKECLKDNDFAKEDSGRTQGGAFLMAYNGKLYQGQRDFDLVRVADGYNSRGAGSAIALGALHATRGEDPMVRVHYALDAACSHSPWCRPPFVVEEWSRREEKAA